ncbi:imelysin family protein [Hyphomicrobium sp. NDB2Meth4]|uniref:imelysin family protein n=1 Tax=Hyphomicrobium sp. NDB2Meth4 TaxID=1892846 RepID=UPI000930FCB8|nr:imelysin family protein [Hyphomicrobium sp. NDB2Meth4]
MLKALAAASVAILLAATTAAIAADAPSTAAVAKNYADIAEASFTDTLIEARKLKAAVDTLIKSPTEDNLVAARKAWIAARVPYMQTEAFRFGNKIVDDWEGRVNAWPLDEGLIDYVSQEYADQGGSNNDLYAANVIANPKLKIGGEEVDATKITKELLSDKLREADGVESNVSTGYHAVEFLLWGQDLNGTGPGAGKRPATDYDTKNCTGGNCDRRAQYLETVTNLLVDDLAFMAAQWGPEGAARKAVMADDGRAGLVALMKGLGSLSYGELAGERMKLGLLIHDPEEEQDCFSDNTHNAHYYDALGIKNVYLGSYKRTDGTIVSGRSASDLVKAKSPEADTRTRAAIDKTLQHMQAIVDRANSVEAYDQMIGEGNAAGNAVVDQTIQALIAQAKEFERDIAALELTAIEFEGSDSLDSPGGVR